MLSIKVHREGAEKVKRYLAKRNLMDNNYRISRNDKFIYFPLRPKSDVIGPKILSKLGAEYSEQKFQKSDNRDTYKKRLKQQLKASYKTATHGYDVIGDIAVVDAGRKDAIAMGKAIMSINKNVKTILSKAGPVSGKYRMRKYLFVMGKKTFSTIYHENGAAFKLDIRKTFFSSRLAFERNRLVNASRNGENVIVMFAGVGPFAIEIAKSHKNSHVVGMELNKDAYLYMVENIKLNRMKNVIAELGDVKKLSRKYMNFADRVIMPLPKDSYEFLDSVLVVAKKHCVVHYYAFGNKNTAFEDHIKSLKKFFSKHEKRIKILASRVVRTYSAKEIEIVIDFSIS